MLINFWYKSTENYKYIIVVDNNNQYEYLKRYMNVMCIKNVIHTNIIYFITIITIVTIIIIIIIILLLILILHLLSQKTGLRMIFMETVSKRKLLWQQKWELIRNMRSQTYMCQA